MQGSVLGPTLFSLYCGELVRQMETTSTTLTTYADDSYVIILADTYEDLLNKTRETLTKHGGLLRNLGLIVNMEKTKVMLMHSRKRSQIPAVGEITIGDQKVMFSDTMKVFGMTFEGKIDWSTHVAQTMRKLSMMMSGL